MSLPRKFWVEYDNDYKGVKVYNKEVSYRSFNEENELVAVIEKSAYDDLLTEYSRLRAKEINNNLRTYDGLAEKYDKLKKVSKKLKRVIEKSKTHYLDNEHEILTAIVKFENVLKEIENETTRES